MVNDIDELEKYWIDVGLLSSFDEEHERQYKDIGLFKATYKGSVVFVGMAREDKNGGLGKRIRDFTSPTKSARSHPAGELLHSKMDAVRMSILTIPDRKSICKIRRLFIRRYNPAWNRNKS